jgi:hypothetical protein
LKFDNNYQELSSFNILVIIPLSEMDPDYLNLVIFNNLLVLFYLIIFFLADFYLPVYLIILLNDFKTNYKNL